MNYIDLSICGVQVRMQQFYDGTFLIQRNTSDGAWFVCTGSNTGREFYLQENYSNGEIREIGTYNNLPDALLSIVQAKHENYIY